MAKVARQLTVRNKQFVTPNLLRLELGGESLADFPTGFEGGYVKVVLSEPEQDSNTRPVVRSYTIRAFDPSNNNIALDIVSHGDTGPGATWANHVNNGDDITITGPGACQPINAVADSFLLAGDMSALPAISVNLEKLPSNAVGDVVLEIISEADKIELNAPAGMRVHWVINPEPEKENSVLEDTVMSLPSLAGDLDGKLSVWIAGEFSASRALRQYFRHEKKLPKEHMYISCYWKVGDTDDGMKLAKRNDPEPW